MLFFEDFLCGFPYEVYPTPAKGKDGEREIRGTGH